jgi:menaquinone-specific isochorismate synthase
MLHELARRGWVTVTVNYGLGPRTRWPGQVVDCKRALAWVRRHIAERLARVATDVRMPDEPIVRRVGSIAHLFTPVSGTLKPGLGLWDAAMALHPTPAVAGSPTDAALRFLGREEPLTRGWYAGGVGWGDAHGNGWLGVGLRSMLWEPGRATVFSGCGIVSGSDPEAEWRESTWKLRPMLEVLGAAE